MRPALITRESPDLRAVSEIIGVTMLLAMVISVMAGVVLVMQPFLEDLTDNRKWVAGSVAATQFNDRVLIAADAPEGSGIVVLSSQLANSIAPLGSAETWVVSADLVGNDRVVVLSYAGTINVTSLNGTPASVEVTTAIANESWAISGSGEHEVNISLSDWFRIEVRDSSGEVIHRQIQAVLDGMRLSTPLKDGPFNIDLINGARVEQLPNQPLVVRAYPRLGFDEMLNGKSRVSLVLMDIETSSTIDSALNRIEITSQGQISFFDDSARNLRIEMTFPGESTREPRYLHHWNEDFELNRVTDNLDDFVGFGPYGRLSGSEGMTIHPTDASIHLDVVMQQVVVT